MPCFYCGKRVSLVRQLNDPDFCSDEHRKRYRELTRTALNRLMEPSSNSVPASLDGNHARPATAAEPVQPPPAPHNGTHAAPKTTTKRRRHADSTPEVFAMPAAPPPPPPPPPPAQAGFLARPQPPSPADRQARRTPSDSPSGSAQPVIASVSAARARRPELRQATAFRRPQVIVDRRFSASVAAGFSDFRRPVLIARSIRNAAETKLATAARAHLSPPKAVIYERRTAPGFSISFQLPPLSFPQHSSLPVAEEAALDIPPLVERWSAIPPGIAALQLNRKCCEDALRSRAAGIPALNARVGAHGVRQGVLASYAHPQVPRPGNFAPLVAHVESASACELPRLLTAVRLHGLAAGDLLRAVAMPGSARVYASPALIPLAAFSLAAQKPGLSAAPRPALGTIGTFPLSARPVASVAARPAAIAAPAIGTSLTGPALQPHPKLFSAAPRPALGTIGTFPLSAGPAACAAARPAALPAPAIVNSLTRQAGPPAVRLQPHRGVLPNTGLRASHPAGAKNLTSAARSLDFVAMVLDGGFPPAPRVLTGKQMLPPAAFTALGTSTGRIPLKPSAPVPCVSRTARPALPAGLETPHSRAVRLCGELRGSRPHHVAPAAGRPRIAVEQFGTHPCAVPDIAAAEGTAFAHAGRRRLEATSFELPRPERPYGAVNTRPLYAGSIPIPGTAGIKRPRAGIEPVRQGELGAPGLNRFAVPKFRDKAGAPNALGLMELRGPRPVEPNSATPGFRRTLGIARPLALHAGMGRGAMTAAAATVEPRGTHPVRLPGFKRPALTRTLSASSLLLFGNGVRNRAADRVGNGWLAIRSESGVVGLEHIASRAAGICSPALSRTGFARAQQSAPQLGAMRIDDALVAAGFAAAGLIQPHLETRPPALSAAPLARIAAARAWDDPASAESTARLTPAFRRAFRPSRLPVFRAAFEKAHMPEGRAFYGFDIDDRDDDRTWPMAPCCPAPPVEPVSPAARFAIRSRGSLGNAALLPVFAGPYGGSARVREGCGTLPFDQELYVTEAGVSLLAMDFDAIAEDYEPRWRSALKTASGFFRGVMLFIPGIILLSTMLTGCSASGGSFRDSIQNRAAIQMEHDFAGGLQGWYGARDWAKQWSRDRQGFVDAGALALYRPSQQLKDYQLEFLAEVGRRSAGWAYRAADLQNYYATKLVVVDVGPPARMALVRFQVIGGQQAQTVKVPLRMNLCTGRPYRIRQDAIGSAFTTYIENEVVDFWTDDRLRAGGVGFFGEKDDRPHLYWMKIGCHDDFWGRICAMIAPNN